MLDDVLRLMVRSPHHRRYSVETVLRCITPPLDLGQCCGIERDARLVAWVSWAWMTPRVADAFLAGRHAVAPEDWCAGTELVFMDFIAPEGDAVRLYSHLKRAFGVHPARWARFAKTGKITEVYHGQR